MNCQVSDRSAFNRVAVFAPVFWAARRVEQLMDRDGVACAEGHQCWVPRTAQLALITHSEGCIIA